MGLWDALGIGRKPEAPAGAAAGGAAREARAAEAPRPVPAHGTPWAPRIDADACRACGTCLDECPTGVFAMGRRDGSARVASPGSCRSDCERCATHCPEEGISFPGRPAAGAEG
jgi:NAD-dependent dihydropyrimidine dehydrogenase PreA subunit